MRFLQQVSDALTASRRNAAPPPAPAVEPSVIRYFGRPILPVRLTPAERAEMAVLRREACRRATQLESGRLPPERKPRPGHRRLQSPMRISLPPSPGIRSSPQRHSSASRLGPPATVPVEQPEDVAVAQAPHEVYPPLQVQFKQLPGTRKKAQQASQPLRNMTNVARDHAHGAPRPSSSRSRASRAPMPAVAPTVVPARTPPGPEARGWDRFSALVKGHLTRQLLATSKAKGIIQTILDTDALIQQFAGIELPTGQDRSLMERTRAQLKAARAELLELMNSSAAKRMQIIAWNR